MKVNIEKLVENEISIRDFECDKLYKQFSEKKITFAEYSVSIEKIFIEIKLLRELLYKYGEWKYM